MDQARRPASSPWVLRYKYGELLEEIKVAFFELTYVELDSLLAEYARRYGHGARSYAMRAIPKWRLGVVQMSGQTMERLLDLVPHFVNADKRFQLIRSARRQTLQLIKRSTVAVKLSCGSTFSDVLGRCLHTLTDLGKVTFPDEFYEIRSWITGNDAQLMERLAVDVERKALEEHLRHTILIIPYILEIRNAIPVGARMTVTVNVPTTQYVITYKKTKKDEKRMNDLDFITSIEKAESDARLQRGEITLHEHLLRNWEQYLSKEQQNELRKIAAREALDLDALRHKMHIQSQAASHDLAQFQALLEKLRETGSKASGTFQTASGEIRIESGKKGCSGLFILAAIIMLGLGLAVGFGVMP